MLDAYLNTMEGLFLLLCAIRLAGKAKCMFTWTLAVLWTFQAAFSIGWGLRLSDPVWQRLNNMMPQWLEIAAFGWLAFWQRKSSVEAAKLAG